MKSIRHARIVVVVASDHGLMLAARLRRMDVAQVIEAGGLTEAAAVCRSGKVDTCIVVAGDMVPDTAPIAEPDAPGRGYGIPTLLMVPAVTAHERRRARRLGYIAVVSAAIPSRLLYRRLGGALQRRSAERRKRRRLPSGIAIPMRALSSPEAGGKPTVH